MQFFEQDVFTNRQGRAMGISDKQLRGRRFRQVCYGVHTAGDPSDLMVRVRAAIKAAGQSALLGGVTELRMLGVWLPQSLADDHLVHITVAPGQRGPRIKGIAVTRTAILLPPTDVGDVFAIHPAEAWFQMATVLALDDLVVAADALMQRKAPLVTKAELQFVIDNSRRRRGLCRARAAVELARPGVDSPMETRLRLAMIAAGLPCPEVNLPLQPNKRSKTFSLDMAYPSARLAVEYDGAIHVGDWQKMQDDRTRRRIIEDAGWRIITVTYADFADLTPAIASIRTALRDRQPKLT